MDIDRQAIERRDFPIARRGYDTAAVDAHLRALAAEFEELQRASADGGEPSLASTASSQVGSILAAAEAAAADIEREALQSASEEREQAARDAERTREDAIGQARAHTAAVAEATSVLLERVASMDGEAGALTESLRAGAGRLAKDLTAVERNMGELYDAASGRVAAAPRTAQDAGRPSQPASPPLPAPQEAPSAPTSGVPPGEPATSSVSGGSTGEAGSAEPSAPAPASANGDLDGARLIALNMALNGQSRADAARYLAENFELADRDKLIEEVYAAIEG